MNRAELHDTFEDAARTALNWTYQSTRDIEFARFRAAGVSVVVEDWDGDQSYWSVRLGDEVIAAGACILSSPYHMDVAMIMAAVAFREYVQTRRLALRSAQIRRDVARSLGEPS